MSNSNLNINVSQLSIYPVKSAAGIDVRTIELGKIGPNYDRRWMVIDANNRPVTQRRYSRMCLIEAQLQNGTLSLATNGREKITVDRVSGANVQSEVWGTPVTGQDCGTRVADWLSEFLGFDCRLIYMPDDGERLVDVNYASNNELVSFADGFPLLLVSQASLNDFNSKLTNPISMARFRPNVVVSGCHAYAEDNWQAVVINGIEFSLVKPCARCIVPSVDPDTGDKQPAVIDALQRYRYRDRNTFFGQNTLYSKQGSISVGDSVNIIQQN